MSPSDDWPTVVPKTPPNKRMGRLRETFWDAYETPGAPAPCKLQDLLDMGWKEDSYIVRCWRYKWGR